MSTAFKFLTHGSFNFSRDMRYYLVDLGICVLGKGIFSPFLHSFRALYTGFEVPQRLSPFGPLLMRPWVFRAPFIILPRPVG